jgi:hypothetical protein
MRHLRDIVRARKTVAVRQIAAPLRRPTPTTIEAAMKHVVGARGLRAAPIE